MADLCLENVQFLNETLTIPIMKYMNKIKEIKNNRTEYPKEVQKFIDKYYGDIEKITSILSKENDKIKLSEITLILRTILGMIASVAAAGIIASDAVSISVAIIGIIVNLVGFVIEPIIDRIRETKDKNALTDLIRVKVALSKIDTDKVDKNYKDKITKCIHNIEDCENLMDSVKTDIK